MAVDLLGPASAQNSITTRPAQTTTYGAIRTWFKACSSLTSQDGTQLTNDYLNNMLAQFRTAFDGTGIVEDNGDDMLLRAIQSIGIRYGSDIGGVNALVVNFSPPVEALAANLTLAAVVAFTNTSSTVTIVANGLATTNIVGNDGNPLAKGQMVGGQVALLQFNAGNFQLLNPVANSGVPANETIFTSSGTWTSGPNTTRVKARVWGAGGGGGGSTTSGGSGLGSGGGGGGYSEGVFTVMPNTTYTVTVGGGGSGGSTGNGTAGGTSNFASLISATGGGGGKVGAGAIATTVGAGGSGSSGALNVNGTGGGLGFFLSGGAYIIAQGGSAFQSSITAQVTGAVAANGPPGQFPGGGAAGGALSGNGGVGSGGLVVLEF